MSAGGAGKWCLTIPPNTEEQTCLERPDGRLAAAPHALIEGLGGLTMLKVAWDAPDGWISNTTPAGTNARDFKRIQFRTAVDFTDPRNRVGQHQDLSLTLVDGDGARSTTSVAAHSVALTDPPRAQSPADIAPHFLLQQVDVPLTVFAGLDLTDIREVRLSFDRTSSGNIAIVDLQLAR